MAKQKTGTIGIHRDSLKRVREIAAQAGLRVGRGQNPDMGSTDQLLEAIAQFNEREIQQLLALLKQSAERWHANNKPPKPPTN